jgi:hypothetical protein
LWRGRARSNFNSLHAIGGEVLVDVGLDCLGGGDVGLAVFAVAGLQLRHAAPVERARELGVERQREVVVGDGVVELAK